ncbi:mCG14725, isoform CRA_b, partial [Mus musculus]
EQLEMTHFFCKAESQLKGADQDDGISWHGPLFCQLGRSDSGFLPRLSLLRAMSRPHGIQSALTWKIGIPPELESRMAARAFTLTGYWKKSMRQKCESVACNGKDFIQIQSVI